MRTVVVPVAFVLLWSSGFVGATLAADAAPPADLLAVRYLVTAAVLLLVLVVLRRRPPLRPRVVAQQVVLGLLAHVVFLGGVFGAAEAGVDAGTSALICAAQPFLVAAAGCCWWRDPWSGRQLLGLVVGLLAVAITVGPAAPSSIATLLPVASMLGLSGAALLERRWQPQIGVLDALVLQVATAAAGFSALAWVDGAVAVPASGDVVIAVAWLVILSGLGGYAAFIASLRLLGAGRTSALLYLTPAVTTLWAWGMFADAPSPGQLHGLGLGAVAVALVLTGTRAAAKDQPPAGVPDAGSPLRRPSRAGR